MIKIFAIVNLVIACLNLSTKSYPFALLNFGAFLYLIITYREE
jgi:hypothetical protein